MVIPRIAALAGAGTMHLDTTLDFITEVENAGTAEQQTAKLLSFGARFGVTNLLAGLMPEASASPDDQIDGLIFGRWPEEWSKRYFQNNYAVHDPTIAQIHNSSKAFRWDEIKSKSEIFYPNIMHEASEFGLRQGFTVPLISLSGRRAGFSFAGEHLDMSDNDQGALTLIAIYSMVSKLSKTKKEKVGHFDSLTSRQKDIVRWAAEGKTDWEISKILGISLHTADKHMRMIKTRLGAVTKTHAIAKAIKLGIVH